jgi:hypothetical protein
MAAATLTAVLERVFGSSLQNAYQESGTQGIGPQHLDLIQILDSGDITNPNPVNVEINVDYAGVVHNPAVNPTNGTRLGAFFALNVADGSSTAVFFANAFNNPSQLDILQNVTQGGNVSYWLDYLGVSHGA